MLAIAVANAPTGLVVIALVGGVVAPAACSQIHAHNAPQTANPNVAAS